MTRNLRTQSTPENNHDMQNHIIITVEEKLSSQVMVNLPQNGFSQSVLLHNVDNRQQ